LNAQSCPTAAWRQLTGVIGVGQLVQAAGHQDLSTTADAAWRGGGSVSRAHRTLLSVCDHARIHV
jgi:hypothetical protein